MAANQMNVILNLNVNQFQKALRNAQKNMERFGRDMQRLGSNMTQTLTLPILGAGGAAVSSAIQFEQLEARLRVLTGSAEQGAAVFERIKTFAAQTPFEVTDLVEASSQLMAFGFSADEALNSLQYLGDIAAATGSNINDISLILGQARTVGVAFTQDLRQLASRGIPVFEMLQKETGLTGKAFNDFVADGGVTFDVLNRILQETASKGGKFFNGMGEQSRTLGGRLSNLKDSAKNAFADLGQAIIESTNLGDRIQQLTRLIDSLVQRFKELSPEAKQTAVNIALFVAAVGPATYVIGKFAIVIGGLFGQMNNLIKAVKSFATFMIGIPGIIIAAIAAITYLYYESDTARKVINGLVDSVVSLVNILKAGTSAVKLFFAVWRGDATSAGTALADLQMALDNFQKQIGEVDFTDPTNRIKGGIQSIKDSLNDALTLKPTILPATTPLQTTTPSGAGGGIDTSQAYATPLLPTFATPEGVASMSAATEQLTAYNTELGTTNNYIERANQTFGFIQNSITPIIDGVFNALESGQNIFKSLARGVKDFVVQLIKAVAQAAILSAIMNILFPGLGAAGGSFSFRKILGGSLGIPGLASGGLVTGPTMALVGEGSGTSLSNPEVVAPLDKLRSMLDGGMNQSGFIAETRIQGSDLLLSIERAERNRNR